MVDHLPGSIDQTRYIEYKIDRKNPSEFLTSYLADRNAFEYGHAKAMKKLGIKSACRMGCTFCCTHDCAWVPEHDAAALVEICAREKLERVVEKAIAQVQDMNAQVAAGVNYPMLGRYPCPFLDLVAGRCLIYKYRPLACIGTFSMDQKSCAEHVARQSKDGWDVPPELLNKILPVAASYVGPDRMAAIVAPRRRKSGARLFPVALAMAFVVDTPLREATYRTAHEAAAKFGPAPTSPTLTGDE